MRPRPVTTKLSAVNESGGGKRRASSALRGSLNRERRCSRFPSLGKANGLSVQLIPFKNTGVRGRTGSRSLFATCGDPFWTARLETSRFANGSRPTVRLPVGPLPTRVARVRPSPSSPLQRLPAENAGWATGQRYSCRRYAFCLRCAAWKPSVHSERQSQCGQYNGTRFHLRVWRGTIGIPGTGVLESQAALYLRPQRQCSKRELQHTMTLQRRKAQHERTRRRRTRTLTLRHYVSRRRSSI